LTFCVVKISNEREKTHYKFLILIYTLRDFAGKSLAEKNVFMHNPDVFILL